MSLASPFKTAFRLGTLVVLGLLLLIPLSMVRGLVDERQSRSREVKNEIAGKWGMPQQLLPPVVSVPWVRITVLKDGKTEREESWVRLFPETLEVVGELSTQTRRRGLFKVPVYTAALDWNGAWDLDQIRRHSPGAGWVLDTTRAVVSVDPGTARSLSKVPLLELDGHAVEIAAERPTGSVYAMHLHSRPFALGGSRRLHFHLALSQRGTESFSIAPAAGATTVRLKSDWKSPSFQGDFLPERSSISATGFDASWGVSGMNLGIPTIWRDGDAPLPASVRRDYGEDQVASSSSSRLQAPVLAVSLVEPVDGYDSIDRSLKYGALVIALAFLALFLFESFLNRALHPVQYGLIGLSLALFYLLLLSISEHLGFETAYAIAASAVTGTVAGYASAALAGWKRGLLLGTGLAILWGFLFTLLKAEDWALLMGSTGLFLIVTLVMWLTRKIDWNRRDLANPPDAKD